MIRFNQTINEIIENHKGLIIGIGLTALIANYQPANAAEKKKDPPKPNITIDLGDGLSINPYTRQAGFSDGNISYGPGFASPNLGKTTDDSQNKSPQEYEAVMQQANVLRINNKPLQERINNLEKALAYTQHISNIENAKVRYSLGALYHYANNTEKSILMFEESLKYDSTNERAKEWIKSIKK